MRRTLPVIGLLVALAFASVALGAVKHYRGPIQQGGHVAFQAKIRHHKAKTVKNFYFFKLKLTCEKAPPGASRSIKISNKSPVNLPFPTMRVNHGVFEGSFYKAQFKTRGEVKGQFSDHYRKAAGTLRVHGRPLGSAFGRCDTGAVDWTAKKR